MTSHNFFSMVAGCLASSNPDDKTGLTRDAFAAWSDGKLDLQGGTEQAVPPAGRPETPILVPPRQLRSRGMGSVEGRATLFHALTQIEFTAINLALDHAVRFRGLPADYYGDWLRIAAEEADHFELLRGYLRKLGYDYGEFPAHGGLWEMAEKTAHDPLARMALVPRCLEARGLDVNPGIKARLMEQGDDEGAALLDPILRDEVTHVAAGDRWFRHFCAVRVL
jgi:uncharacterized ferritin-like protein (DUF455 family)